MEPYWLFFKTVVHTVASLLTAAAVLFGWTSPPSEARRAEGHVVRASVGRSFQAGHVASGSISPGEMDTHAISVRLHAADPLARASGACEARKLGALARPLIADLAALLSDDAQVPADVCGDIGRSWNGVPDEPTTPGEKAAAALARIGSAAFEPVAAALAGPHVHARKNAAWALGAIEDQRGVRPLMAAVRDSAAVVRRNAAWALGAIENREAVPALIGALKDSDPETRAHAAWALGALDDERAVAPLVAALKDQDTATRAQAAWALGAIGEPAAVEGLAQALRQDDNPKVRAQAAWALGAIGDDRAASSLAAALKDGDVKVRRHAAWALGAIQR